jgi:hypothetical protein
MIRANNAQQETKMKKADQSCKKKLRTIYPALLMFLGLSCDYLTPQTIHAAASQDVTQNITYETNKNTNNIFTPQVDGQPFSNLIDFFDTIKQSPGASSGFFDQILKNYNENGQKHFIFEVQKDKHGSLCFKLIYGNSAGIDPMEDYNPNRDDYVKGFQEHIKFQESVQDNEKDRRSTTPSPVKGSHKAGCKGLDGASRNQELHIGRVGYLLCRHGVADTSSSSGTSTPSSAAAADGAAVGQSIQKAAAHGRLHVGWVLK